MSELDLYRSNRGEGGFFCCGFAMWRLGEDVAGDKCPRRGLAPLGSTWLQLGGSTLAEFCCFCDRSCIVFHPFMDMEFLEDSSFWVPRLEAL